MDRPLDDVRRHRPAPPGLPEAIYKVVLLLPGRRRRRPGRSRRRLVRRADVVHASVARVGAVHAAVDVRPNGEADTVRAQRNRGARLIAGVLAVDVFAELSPVGPIVWWSSKRLWWSSKRLWRRQGLVREELMEVGFRNSARTERERAPRKKKTPQIVAVSPSCHRSIVVPL